VIASLALLPEDASFTAIDDALSNRRPPTLDDVCAAHASGSDHCGQSFTLPRATTKLCQRRRQIPTTFRARALKRIAEIGSAPVQPTRDRDRPRKFDHFSTRPVFHRPRADPIRKPAHAG